MFSWLERRLNPFPPEEPQQASTGFRFLLALHQGRDTVYCDNCATDGRHRYCRSLAIWLFRANCRLAGCARPRYVFMTNFGRLLV